jgi:hypothetical protein
LTFLTKFLALPKNPATSYFSFSKVSKIGLANFSEVFSIFDYYSTYGLTSNVTLSFSAL